MSAKFDVKAEHKFPLRASLDPQYVSIKPGRYSAKSLTRAINKAIKAAFPLGDGGHYTCDTERHAFTYHPAPPPRLTIVTPAALKKAALLRRCRESFPGLEIVDVISKQELE